MNRCLIVSLAILVMASAAKAQFIADGNFDGLSAGNIPNCDQYAGAWGWPAHYLAAGVCEPESSAYQIVATNTFDPGKSGNSMQLRIVNAPTSVGYQLPNVFAKPILEEPGQLVVVEFGVWVAQAGMKGGSIYVGGDHGGGGFAFGTDRGPQMSWLANGTWVCANPLGGSPIVVMANYPVGAWLTVRLAIDLTNDVYDVWYSPPSGGPFTRIAINMPFRSGTLDHLDRFTVANFDFPQVEPVQMYVDHVSVEEISTVPGDVTGDGHANIDDLVQVITHWGACPASVSPCSADITPFPGGDGVVNIDDLVTVITHWG